MRARSAKVRVAGGLVVLTLLVAGAFFALRTPETPKKQRATEVDARPPAPRAPPATPAARAREDAAAAATAKPHEPSAPHGSAHPHPLTAEHERIFEENRLFAAISAAMDRRDAVTMRQLLGKYEREYPEDAHLLQVGFAVIADCLDRPGQASTAAARAFYDENKGSILRRYVRRHCFDADAG